jgi:hypothetical protein
MESEDIRVDINALSPAVGAKGDATLGTIGSGTDDSAALSAAASLVSGGGGNYIDGPAGGTPACSIGGIALIKGFANVLAGQVSLTTSGARWLGFGERTVSQLEDGVPSPDFFNLMLTDNTTFVNFDTEHAGNPFGTVVPQGTVTMLPIHPPATTVDSLVQLCTRTGVLSYVWSAKTAFPAGSTVQPTADNTFYYYTSGGGTTGSTEPSWPTTVGGPSFADGSVSWVCAGTSAGFQSSGDLEGFNYFLAYSAGPLTGFETQAQPSCATEFTINVTAYSPTTGAAASWRDHRVMYVTNSLAEPTVVGKATGSIKPDASTSGEGAGYRIKFYSSGTSYYLEVTSAVSHQVDFKITIDEVVTGL